MIVKGVLIRMTLQFVAISTIVACAPSGETSGPTAAIQATPTLETMPAPGLATYEGMVLPRSGPVYGEAAQHLPPAWLIAGDKVVLPTYGSYTISYRDESSPPGENGEVTMIVEHADMVPPESNPDLATVVLSADEQAVILIGATSIKTFEASVVDWSDLYGPSRRILEEEQEPIANLTAFVLEPTGSLDDQLLSISITFAGGEATYLWRLNPALVPGLLHGSSPCELPAADAHADVGDPHDEPCHNLFGWGTAEIGGPVIPPSGDRSKRFQRLRGDNRLDLMIPQAHVPYTLVTEVEDGGSDDSFEIYVNGQGPVYTYQADPAIEAAVVHTIPITAALITDTTITLNFRNIASDESGLAAVFNAAAVAGIPQDIKGPFAQYTPAPAASPLAWKRSPVWTGDQSGPQDANRQLWHDPRFDDAAWTPVTLPDGGRDTSADNRYYRSHFSWDGDSPVTIHFAADDGISIYINGNRLGSWENGWRQEGCINNPGYLCSVSTEVSPQIIPAAMLQTGDNVIAVDLWNAAVCCDYYLDVSVVSMPPVDRTPGTSPAAGPPIQPVTADRRPTIPHDLLWLDQHKLMRWNHTSGELEILAGPGALGRGITCYSVTDDGQQIVLAGNRGVDRYEISLLELATGQQRTVITTTRPLIDLAISGDGQWLAYLVADEPAGEVECRSKVANMAMYPLAAEAAYAGPIYVLRLDASEQPAEMARCRSKGLFGPCSQVLWSPDKVTLLWTDAEGVWLSDLNSSQPELLVRYVSNPPDPVDTQVYHPWRWSPSGRYVLTSVVLYEGLRQAVIDTQTKQVIDVPDTGVHGDPGSMLTWLADGRLLLLRPAVGYSNALPAPDDPVAAIEIWRIESGQPSRLVRERSVTLDLDRRTVPTGDSVQLTDDRLAFALINADPTRAEESGLYLADPGNLKPRKVAGAPPLLSEYFYYQVGLTWSPDGSGVIFQDWGLAGMLLYIPTTGETLYDLRPIISEDACCFTWLP